MSEHVLLTGFTGAIGRPLGARLLARPGLTRLTAVVRPSTESATLPAALARLNPDADLTKLKIVAADLGDPDSSLNSTAADLPVDAVIHGAAVTQFNASEDQWQRVNVEGTRRLLRWRDVHCPRSRFIHLSTLCAAGKRIGFVPERAIERPEGFVNGYEASKWQAEQLVQEATGDRVIVRLATVIGSLADGSLGRVGAFHHVLRWVYLGLLPLIPGDHSTRLDLIPTELVTVGIGRLLDRRASESLAFHHFSRGAAAIPLGKLIDICSERFRKESAAWQRGQVTAPVLASKPAFKEFRQSVVASRDFLFMQVMDSVDSFLPELFFPKEFGADSLAELFGGGMPLTEWKLWMERVLDFSLRSNFGRNL